jgi:hypothetical protein
MSSLSYTPYNYSIKGSASPSWNSVLTFEHDSASSKTLTVQVCSEKDGAIVSTISMPTAQLLEQSAVALDGDGASGSAVIAVHCQEYTLQPGTLQLQLRGVNLKNMERGLGWIRKSDPYFELLKSMDGYDYKLQITALVEWGVLLRVYDTV